MGEEVRGVPEAPPLGEGEPRPQAGIGRYLAGQRRLRDMSLDDLATLTKIPRRSLERLESGAFDGAPDGFVRGFVRAVASALGLDPDEAVMRLLEEPAADQQAAAADRRVMREQRALFARAALLAALVLAAVGVWQLVGLWMAPPAEEAPSELVLRRDPVRELVREGAGRTGQAPAPTAPAPDAH